MAAALSRQVQLTRIEFLRELPGAVGNMKYRVSGDEVTIEEGTRCIRIHLTDLGVEEKGELDLPMQQVDFSFENMTDIEIQDFMSRWDEYKLRMGG